MREKIRKTENLIFSILLMFLFIDLAVILTLNCRQLYYLDIDYLDISEGSGLNEEVIRRNYDVLIDYNSMFSREELESLSNKQFQKAFGMRAFAWRGKKTLLRNMDCLEGKNGSDGNNDINAQQDKDAGQENNR